ncbi:TPA: PH domain-containing protein [Bacillus pseudomycoides]|nr:PH domain-containing protein [Bacillus pseudomycoides]
MSMLQNTVNKLLHENETILFHKECSLSLFLHKGPSVPGVILTTNNRMLFIYKEKDTFNPTRYEEYIYENIKEVKEHPYFFNSHISIYYNDEWIQFRDIYDKNVRKQLCSIIQKQISTSPVS